MLKVRRHSVAVSRASRAALYAPIVAASLSLLSTTLAGQTLPDRLSDSTFWSLVSNMSEPAGFFRSENFVSNESNWQVVIPRLLPVIKQGGAYVGVGPEQNFTYLVAFKPRIAFIVDIRRQNLLQHLWYKATIELSADRADFLSRLFGRARPKGVDANTSADSLLAALEALPPDSVVFAKTFVDVRDLLVNKHHFALSAEDLASLHHVDSAFYYAGTSLNYSFGTAPRGGYMGGMPSFGQLMRQTDGTDLNRSFIGSEENYRILRDMQLRNVIVPIVGDFGGDKALSAVGNYIRSHGAVVNTFYLSNVEQYLFMSDGSNGGWRNFYTTVSQFPLDSTSTFIRSFTNRGARFIPPSPSSGIGGMMAQLTSSIQDVIAAFKTGNMQSYNDVISLSKQP